MTCTIAPALLGAHKQGKLCRKWTAAASLCFGSCRKVVLQQCAMLASGAVHGATAEPGA